MVKKDVSPWAWAEERFSRVAKGQLLHKIYKYTPIQNIHYRPWMAPIEVFESGGAPFPPSHPPNHFLGLWPWRSQQQPEQDK